MRREQRGTSFLARQAQLRATPGHCPRCGRQVNGPTPHAKCEPCKAYVRHRKAQLRASIKATTPQVETVNPATVYRLQQEVAEIREHLRNIKRAAAEAYNRGYAKGTYAELRRWRDMPRDWTAWSQPIDMADKKQHYHALREAASQ